MDEAHFKFFTNTACEYYPCHDFPRINCLFCFCPLYALECGGLFTVSETGVKDCSRCTLPHSDKGYDYVIYRLKNPPIP